MSALPQQPYFLRALYEWCVDSGYTPYLSVRVDSRTRVPQGFVKDGMIVLNIGPSAVRNMHMDNEWVSFSARFGGVAHTIEVPVGNVLSIYARETGQGMGFAEMALDASAPVQEGGDRSVPAQVQPAQADNGDSEGPGPQPPKGRPQLRVIK
ncbi:MAG: ClpXP protease specificity-enhancing factor [Pseudomonadota bacterium]